MSFTPRAVRDGAEFRGMRVAGDRVLQGGHGTCVWLIDEPRVRTWSDTGVLVLEEPAQWRFEETDDGVTLRCSDSGAEADAVELGPEEAAAFERDSSEPLTVIPSFRPLAGPDDLAHYLVGGRVVTGSPRARWQVEQAALSIYRIARLRGGAFWEGVADHVADWTVQRVEDAADGRPVTDHWGEREVHARFVADAALLLAAHAELRPGGRVERAAARAADAIETFAVPFAGGRWYLHDSVEQHAGRNDLVLNTHLHAINALRAAGRDTEAGLRALAAALRRRAGGPSGIATGAAVAIAELAGAFGPQRVARPLAHRVHHRVADVAGRERVLRLPGGFVARDASAHLAPTTYLAVNLSDLAVLQRNTPSPAAAAALAGGLAHARRFAYMRAELRGTAPAVQVLVPHALRNAGREREAARAAALARRAGLAPIVGWPGYEDALWSRLAAGTP